MPSEKADSAGMLSSGNRARGLRNLTGGSGHFPLERLPLSVQRLPLRARIDPVSLDDLTDMLRCDESFVIQIELEDCPACQQLHEEESQIDFVGVPIVRVEISENEREEARERLKDLFPGFKYYPSIYQVEKER